MHFYLQIVHFLKWLGMGFIGEKVRATASVILIAKSLVFKSLFLRLLERFFLVGWLVGWAKGMSADYEEILDVPKPQQPKTKIPKVVNF